jgi:hypothetical protein
MSNEKAAEDEVKIAVTRIVVRINQEVLNFLMKA